MGWGKQGRAGARIFIFLGGTAVSFWTTPHCVVAFLTYLFSGRAARAVRILGTAIGGDGEGAYLPPFFGNLCGSNSGQE